MRDLIDFLHQTRGILTTLKVPNKDKVNKQLEASIERFADKIQYLKDDMKVLPLVQATQQLTGESPRIGSEKGYDPTTMRS